MADLLSISAVVEMLEVFHCSQNCQSVCDSFVCINELHKLAITLWITITLPRVSKPCLNSYPCLILFSYDKADH